VEEPEASVTEAGRRQAGKKKEGLPSSLCDRCEKKSGHPLTYMKHKDQPCSRTAASPSMNDIAL